MPKPSWPLKKQSIHIAPFHIVTVSPHIPNILIKKFFNSNFINVTGLASTHYWALVAGIEVQDSDDLIWNNTIIVNNIGNYSANNNIYGISYSQNTQGNHTYNIQYNNVTTNGRYAVSLSGTSSLVVNSIIANNVLNTNQFSGNRAVHIGRGNNNTIRNNTDGVFRNTMSEDDLPDWLKNHKGLVPRIVFLSIIVRVPMVLD